MANYGCGAREGCEWWLLGYTDATPAAGRRKSFYIIVHFTREHLLIKARNTRLIRSKYFYLKLKL